MTKTAKQLFVLSLIIKLLLLPWFYHPDIKSQYFHFQYLSRGVTNIYQYIDQNKTNLPYQDTFNYLPLTYFTFGTYSAIVQKIAPPNFSTWINDWSDHQNNYANLPVFLFLLKLPYLFLDTLIGLLIYRLYPKKNYYLLWLFNPLVFYLIYVLQNFDILPVFFTFLAFYLLKRQRPSLSFFIFGLSIALKFYSLLLLPFFLISTRSNFSKLIKYSFISLIPLLFSVLPFINDSSFIRSFIGSGLTQKIIEFKLFSIPVFPIIYILYFLYSWRYSPSTIFKNITFIFLLFVCLVNFHSQWLLWFYPFYLLAFASSPKKLLLGHLLFLPLLLRVLLIDDNYLTWGHLIPIDPLFVKVTSPYNLIRYRLMQDPLKFQIIFQYLTFLTSFIIFFAHEKNNRH
ncbi:MAG: hypothetical protein WC885_00370 [Candidatus Shapirobacteria bacterium]